MYKSCINNPWPLLLFLLGATVRILYITSIPPGLNQDEASIGYDAYAILHYGMDRNGVRLPVHLIAWGSGQNALYAYLSMPFLLLFGLTPLSVRALSLVMGLLSMIIFYLIMRQLSSSSRAGTAAMFFIAINPWHIMMSRWALESNLFPTLILIALYFLLRSLSRPGWLYAFSGMLALSLYAYGTAYFFVPLFAFGTAILLLYSRGLKLRTLAWNALLFAAMALPILLFIIINHYSMQNIATPLFTIPKLTMPRVEQISSVFGGQLLETAAHNFSTFCKLMYSGSDGLPWNSIAPYGYAYPAALPFAGIGLIVTAHAWWTRRREAAGQGALLLWLLLAVLMAFITDVNINRINIVFYPFIMLVSAGFMWLAGKVRGAAWLAAAVFALMFILFSNSYFREFPDRIGPAFFESFGEAVEYASDHSQGEVYIANEVNMPYIFVLFYERISPRDFQDSVLYANPGDAFQQVTSFGRYKFGSLDTVPADAAYIFGNNSPVPAAGAEYTITRFTGYSVMVTNSNQTGGAGPNAPEVTAAAAGDFRNGGFEEGTPGWSFTAGTGVASNNPYAGRGLAYLDPGTDKSVSQLFAAEPGEYKLSVMVSSGGSGGKFGIRMAGAVLAEAELPAGENYTQISLPAVTLDQSGQAEIYITGGNGWINIDEVRVER
ncbi:phospholipid carrier-dependent glycosyltransferase [Paenibacillus sp. MMS20-IR301]|uniref:ArnT family glycosyltransferase n=1 Tax=Paenibacillus sp. MMS20-IR301 TaxID=2895946 RepID=UPI0028EB07EB|nr:glycosyltransferase family 39 protein [Paenibacillus sp. MMS20-IR301]WNS41629.1 glycosyltransferase family 39 protein [Paenibacillus sp. MMS20-IR301]